VSGGKEVASLAGHTNIVLSVAFSPDGQHIVSGSGGKFVGAGVGPVCVTRWREGGCIAGTRIGFSRSPSVPTGNK
jgi:hypothetical protein